VHWIDPGHTVPVTLLNSKVVNLKPAADTVDAEKKMVVQASKREIASPGVDRRNRLLIELTPFSSACYTPPTGVIFY